MHAERVGRRGERARATTGFAVVLAGLGLALLVQGLWIPAKAWLAQHLIARAWQDMRGGADQARPWPWADTWPVAKISFPDGSRPLYALAGASGQSLAFGPAHVSASAAPGSGDNVVFAGHRDTHFARLESLAPGDTIEVESASSTRTYRVSGSAVLHESRVEILERSGRAELTLITCYPFDAIVPGGPLRYVVFARAVEDSSERPAETDASG